MSKSNSLLIVVLNEFTNDSRVLKISQSLSAKGYSVTVVALHKNGLIKKEKKDNIIIDRLRLLSRSWPKIKPIQFLKYLEFILRSVIRYRNHAICHCNDLNSLPVGLLIKLFGKNVKVIYDCHEYETELDNLKGLEKKLKKHFEKSLIYFADKVITVSNSISEEYSRLYSIVKPNVVLNCPNFIKYKKYNLFREKFSIDSNQKIFLYQGALSKGRGLEILLEAFSKFNSKDNVLVCMGYGPLETLIKQHAQKYPNIFFQPAVPPDLLLRYTSSADFGISFIEDLCLSYRYCLPNKMFEYLMAGLPIITSNLYEMKHLVETEGLGIVTKENTVLGFKNAVKASLNQDYQTIQQNVIKVRKKYCWEEQEKVLHEIYYDLV